MFLYGEFKRKKLKMEKPFLSICIPTYNRVDTLKVLLDSMTSQDTHELQIVISDNGSTDGSKELIESYSSYFHNYKIHYFDKNMGFVSNILNVVTIAEGEYCWIVGSDDAVLPNAVTETIAILKSKSPNLFLFNRIQWNFESKVKIKEYWISKLVSEFQITQVDSQRFGEYLDIANSVGALFSYISTVVFKRSIWNKYRDGNELQFFGHPQSYMHIKNVFDTGNFYYKNIHLVYCRFGGEDSALDSSNPHKRVLLDLEEFKIISNLAIKDEILISKFNGVLKRYTSITKIIKVFYYGQHDNSLSASFKMFESIGFSKFLLFGLLIISKPKFIRNLGFIKSNIEKNKYSDR
jgi:abequosyltransferase